MEEKLVTAHAQISTKFLKEEIVKGVDVRDAYDDTVSKSKREARPRIGFVDVRDAYDYEDKGFYTDLENIREAYTIAKTLVEANVGEINE